LIRALPPEESRPPGGKTTNTAESKGPPFTKEVLPAVKRKNLGKKTRRIQGKTAWNPQKPLKGDLRGNQGL